MRCGVCGGKLRRVCWGRYRCGACGSIVRLGQRGFMDPGGRRVERRPDLDEYDRRVVRLGR
jgi:hypothetical protein